MEKFAMIVSTGCAVSIWGIRGHPAKAAIFTLLDLDSGLYKKLLSKKTRDNLIMATIHIKMEDVIYCLVCNKYIGKGNDPALCDDEGCWEEFEYECAFNKWAKQQHELYKQSGGDK